MTFYSKYDFRGYPLIYVDTKLAKYSFSGYLHGYELGADIFIQWSGYRMTTICAH